MLYIAVCVCFAVSVLSAPAPTDVVPLEKQQPTVIPILSQSDELEANGTYHFSYETGNGIKREEIAYDKVIPKARSGSKDSNEGGEEGDSDEIHVQMGSYSYTAPDGTLISVRYIADENGFQPIGDHIPRVPSVSGTGSNEKSGRALKASDNAGSESAPVAAEKSVEKPKAVPLSAAAPATKLDEPSEKASTSVAAPGEISTKTADFETSTTEAAKASEAASTTVSSFTEASTTEAVKFSQTDIPAEISTTEIAKITGAPEPSTPNAGEVSTLAVEVSTQAAEQSTPNSETSTTEIASPTKVAA